jgi:hypothetical protein
MQNTNKRVKPVTWRLQPAFPTAKHRNVKEKKRLPKARQRGEANILTIGNKHSAATGAPALHTNTHTHTRK